LNSHACPGHVGHIELPVPVFNVTFMAQMMRLLRSQCSYCGRLKLRRAEVNRFACKLKLIQHGLLQESEELENIQLRPKSEKSVAINGSAAAMVEGSDESEEDEDSLVDRRNAFVRQSLKRFKGKNALARMEAQKVEVVAEQRRAVVKEFLSTVSATRTCGSCKG
jgi:DNA-directed RNA polymerase I subunit RPA1